MREDLIRQLEAYVPFNEIESKDRLIILDRLRSDPDVFLRSSLMAHVTSSAWCVNRDMDRVVMAYHNIYDSWAWLGGHADGEEDLLSVAVREVKEESGLRTVVPVLEDIFSIELLTVNGHVKRGEWVPSHLHLNFTYLLMADDTEPLQNREGENSSVAWFTPQKAVEASSEPWFREHVYSKLNEKMYLQRARGNRAR